MTAPLPRTDWPETPQLPDTRRERHIKPVPALSEPVEPVFVPVEPAFSPVESVPVPRLTAFCAADDGSRAWWAEQGGRVWTAALPAVGEDVVQLATLAVLQVGQHETDVTALAATLDGRLVLSGALDGEVRAWDAVAGTQLASWRVDGAVTSLSLATDGSLLVVGASGGGALLAEVPSFAIRRTLRGHREAVTAVAIQGARRLVATAGLDGTVRTWDPLGGGARLALRGEGAPVMSLALGKDAQFLATGALDGHLTVWQTRTGQALWRAQPHSAGIASVAMDRAGAFVATASDDWTARVFRVGGGEPVASRADFAAGVRAVVFVEGALAVLAASWDGTVRRITW